MLQTGTNHVIIKGLSPTVLADSIKIEGTGSAVITDLNVELLPNREIFEEVYSETLDTRSEPDSDPDRDEDDASIDAPELKAVQDKVRHLHQEQKAATEAVWSAESRMRLLDAYGHSIASDSKAATNIADALETYRIEREKMFRDFSAGKVKETEIRNEIETLQKVAFRLMERVEKDRAKARIAKEKEAEKQRRKEQEQTRERRRVRKERESFWPRKVYTVKVTLEIAKFTPSSSRRSSIASEIVKPVVEEPNKSGQATSEASTCDLTLSYVTNHAFWCPTYDLTLSTTNNSGMRPSSQKSGL
jgi:DNA polymerase III alpha subunit (gram-positive type)